MRAELSRDFESVYAEVERVLQRVARKGHTLDVPALVHEVYLRFARKADRDGRWWRDGGHLISTAAMAAGQILSNYDRDKGRDKRGGPDRAFTLNEEVAGSVPLDYATFIDLNRAIESFAGEDPERVQVVWLRFYAGLSVDETAEALAVSRATVIRAWRVAKPRLSVLMDGYAPDAIPDRAVWGDMGAMVASDASRTETSTSPLTP